MCQVQSEKHSLRVTWKVAQVLQAGLSIVEGGYVAPRSLLPDGWVGSWERKRRWSGRGQSKQEGQYAALITSSGDDGTPPLGAALTPGPGAGEAEGQAGLGGASQPVGPRAPVPTSAGKTGSTTITQIWLCVNSQVTFYYLYFYLLRLLMKL